MFVLKKNRSLLVLSNLFCSPCSFTFAIVQLNWLLEQIGKGECRAESKKYPGEQLF